ncbi:ATP-binding protein [Caballeronia novacaledonica]|uniref:ATP-binding protein n=1 Tax=Caballeronia novacaledonica TaxID=1544861 RepID=A0ACB5R6N7_9BURK|nr:AAA family ATPase [Caballeronia sp. LZ029]MDR5746982.1 AAA family ATPase [Caballeronia sp. LZ029]GJH22657.1 ATP-binding protein [Caballeronia novacaledonica]
MRSSDRRTASDVLCEAFGPNPLLDALGSKLAPHELAERLCYRPLDKLAWSEVPLEHREDFLPLIESHFVPTPTALDVARRIQQLLRSGYIERHPGVASCRKRMHEIAALPGALMCDLPWFATNAKGMAIRGITGVGKSATWTRTLSLFPQVVDHGPNENARWLRAKQLVYVVAQMSADTSRAGFLANILKSVDRALNTNYHDNYIVRNRPSIEKLMVIVAAVLSDHYCGVLIIEEIQERNFAASPERKNILLFFLRLLNFGIPVVLVGNPLGFSDFDEFAQDIRRLYKAGAIDLWPASNIDDIEWNEFFIPGKIQFNVVNAGFELTPELKSVFFQCSAGVHGYFEDLWRITQAHMIRRKERKVTAQRVLMAYQSDDMKEQRPVIRALYRRDLQAMSNFKDIPTEHFAAHWSLTPTNNIEKVHAGTPAVDRLPSSAPASAHLTVPRFVKAEQKFQRQKKNQKIEEERVRRLSELLDPQDLRSSQARELLQQEAEALHRALHSPTSSSRPDKHRTAKSVRKTRAKSDSD